MQFSFLLSLYLWCSTNNSYLPFILLCLRVTKSLPFSFHPLKESFFAIWFVGFFLFSLFVLVEVKPFFVGYFFFLVSRNVRAEFESALVENLIFLWLVLDALFLMFLYVCFRMRVRICTNWIAAVPVMEERNLPSPASVADAFVKQYFVILDKSPENLHKFYQETSLLGWPRTDGVVTPVTTLNEINEFIMSSDYKNCSMEVNTIDAQESQDGGIMVAVTGCLTGEDDVKKNFSQTFFLAKQEKGFFVLNDILRIFDVCASITAGSNKDDQPVPTQNSSLLDNCGGSLDFKAAIQNGKVEETSSLPLSENNLESGHLPPHSIPSSNVPLLESEKGSVVAAAISDKVPSVIMPITVPQKITYASVVAKLMPSISPRTSKQTVASPTPKPSSPLCDISPKVSTPHGVSKASTSSSRIMAKSPTRGQGAPNISAYSEATGIYIGGLPHDITIQGIVNVVKQFGEVRRHSETVQIRRHEDGFCCGFVEFESADSARRAVEAHRVMFIDKEAYVTYKRIPHNRGNNNIARSPTGGEQRNGRSTPTRGDQRNSSSTGRVDDDWTYNTKGRSAKNPHWTNSSSDQWSRHTSRDNMK